MSLIPFTSIKTLLPGTLGELNANITDANLDDSGDSRTPSAHNHNASNINAGVLAHERGGIEADISGVVKGGLLHGTGTGAMGILGVGASGQRLAASAGDVAWTDHVDGITFNWPNPVTSPDPDEVPIGKVLPFAITLIHVRMHVVAGTGTVVFQIYDRAWDGSGSGTDSIKTTGDFSASTTASTITALVTALAAERQLIIKAISQTGSPTLVRVWIRYKLA